jgi:hypothetical protein
MKQETVRIRPNDATQLLLSSVFSVFSVVQASFLI